MHTEMSEPTRALEPALMHLTDEDAERAIEVARRQLVGELSGRHRFLGAEPLIEKPPERGATPARTVAVLVIDYERRRTLEAIVEVGGTVLRVVDLGGFQPAFAPEEVREAEEIAGADERVARITRTEGVATSTFMPAVSNIQRARQVGLHYVATKNGRGVRLVADVIVDLEQRVVGSVEMLAEVETEEG